MPYNSTGMCTLTGPGADRNPLTTSSYSITKLSLDSEVQANTAADALPEEEPLPKAGSKLSEPLNITSRASHCTGISTEPPSTSSMITNTGFH